MICRRIANRSSLLVTPLILMAAIGCGDAREYEFVTLAIDASCDSPFGYIGGVRELSDKRVMVADPLGVALVMVDLESASVDTIGQVGSGPDEYRQPDHVLPLPADSTLLVDLGNSRLVVVDPNGRFREALPIAIQTASGSPALVVPRFADRSGRLYFLAEGAGSRRDARGAVARFDRSTRVVDTLAFVALPDRSRPPPPARAGPAIPPDLFEPRDDWAVADDGYVATISARDYLVTWVSPTGDTTLGTPTPAEPVRVEEADKEQLLAQLLASQLTMRAGGETGEIGMRRGSGTSRLPDVDRIDWPETLPLIRPARSVVSHGGFLWTERYVVPEQDPLVDVFDRDGVKIAEITLPTGRRVVGFGEGTVFLARVDEFGLEWLERYHLPD